MSLTKSHITFAPFKGPVKGVAFKKMVKPIAIFFYGNSSGFDGMMFLEKLS